MSRVLRVDANDQRIRTSGPWFGAAGDHSLTCDSKSCLFFLLFRGTGIKISGRTTSLSLGGFYLVLDGYSHDIVLNGTTSIGGVAPIYSVGNMGDGDHQLIGSANMMNGTFVIDNFEIETSSGDGFDLLSAGPSAQDVPAQALTVDNIDPAILYDNESNWSKHAGGLQEYGGSVSAASTAGASLSFSFDGVAIWFYGHMCAHCGPFKVSIDGSTPQWVNASRSSDSYDLFQRMIWSNTTLDPGRHTLNITNVEENLYQGVYLDFFRVLPGASTSTLLSSSSTMSLGELPTTASPDPPTQISRVPLAVGLTFGLLVLAVVVLCGVRHVYRRRERRPIGLDAHSVSPYTAPPIRRADQQPIIPQVRKSVLRHARPPGAPMATVDPSMPLSETGSRPPPSYETPSYDWRVDTAQ